MIHSGTYFVLKEYEKIEMVSMKIHRAVDSLAKMAILLVLFISVLISIKINAQTPGVNKWFVDKNATGANNGTSWENAWISFANINWNLILPGSTVYISGGSDLTVYNELLTIDASGTTANLITIRSGCNIRTQWKSYYKW